MIPPKAMAITCPDMDTVLEDHLSRMTLILNFNRRLPFASSTTLLSRKDDTINAVDVIFGNHGDVREKQNVKNSEANQTSSPRRRLDDLEKGFWAGARRRHSAPKA